MHEMRSEINTNKELICWIKSVLHCTLFSVFCEVCKWARGFVSAVDHRHGL